MTDHELPEEDERVYDLWPPGGSTPWPLKLYEGSSIGALYAGRLSARQAAQLAGWSQARPESREHQLEGWDYEPGSTE